MAAPFCLPAEPNHCGVQAVNPDHKVIFRLHLDAVIAEAPGECSNDGRLRAQGGLASPVAPLSEGLVQF